MSVFSHQWSTFWTEICVWIYVCMSLCVFAFPPFCLLVSVISLSQTLTHIHICAHMCRVTGWPQKCSADTIYFGLQNQKSKIASKLVTNMYTVQWLQTLITMYSCFNFIFWNKLKGHVLISKVLCRLLSFSPVP